MLLLRGRHAEFHYRYESWVQLASRRPPARVDLAPLAAELNQQETAGGRWIFEGVDKITPKLRLDGSPTSSIDIESIRKALERHLQTGTPAWNPYD